MNAMQRFSRELVQAANAADAPRDTSLVWRGQVIERIAVAGDDNDDSPERRVSWLDRAVAGD